LQTWKTIQLLLEKTEDKNQKVRKIYIVLNRAAAAGTEPHHFDGNGTEKQTMFEFSNMQPKYKSQR
jgi:hypothetical protein